MYNCTAMFGMYNTIVDVCDNYNYSIKYVYYRTATECKGHSTATEYMYKSKANVNNCTATDYMYKCTANVYNCTATDYTYKCTANVHICTATDYMYKSKANVNNCTATDYMYKCTTDVYNWLSLVELLSGPFGGFNSSGSLVNLLLYNKNILIYKNKFQK